MRGRKTEVLQTTYLTHGRTSQPSAHRAPSSRAGSALPLPYPPVLQCFLRVTPFPAAIPAPQPAQRRSKQAVLMCLLLLLKFCLGRELTLIITPRAADRPIPASAGLRGTSGRGLKENATPRRGVNQRRTEFISSQRSAEHDPEGARGSIQDRPTGDTPRGAVGRSGAGCAQGQPRAAVPPRPRVLRAQRSAASPLPYPTYVYYFYYYYYFSAASATLPRHTRPALFLLLPPRSAPRGFFRGDESADRARRCCGGTACPAERSALRLSGFWRAARRGAAAPGPAAGAVSRC